MRRSLALLAALLTALLSVGVLLTAPMAGAAESVPDGAWAGSALDPGPASVSTNAYRLSGTFRHRFNRAVEIRVSTSPAGSGPCAVAPAVVPSGPTPRAFNVTLRIPCNGTYTIAATAVTTDNNALVGPEAVALDRRISVAAPAPMVTGVVAEADGRSVTITWDDMQAGAPDLDHYIVERKVGNGDFAELGQPAPDEQSFIDEDLPAAGGEATYRVLSARPAPGGMVTSQSSDEAATTFDAAPTDPTTAGAGSPTGDGAGSAGSGGDPGSAGGASGSGSGSAGGGSSAGHRSAAVTPPRVFSGTFLPPLLRPATESLPARTTPTTVDDGYEDALPYAQAEEGAQDPVLPDGAMASITAERGAGRGMVIPLATALVLAVWAFHLRLLARAARPLD
jgi:hypothetical protein